MSALEARRMVIVRKIRCLRILIRRRQHLEIVLIEDLGAEQNPYDTMAE
jgi:hypothetical protein